MLAIKNNIMAGNAARHLGKAYDSLAKSVERLSSGLRINGAKDDAAGLAVRELIRADVAVLKQGSRNAQDGISMLQTMEGAMGVIDENLIRMKELAEQAATGSYSDAQREIMNAEFAQMAAEIDRISSATKFNDISMLSNSTGDVKIHVGTAETIDVDNVDMTATGLGVNVRDTYNATSDTAKGVATTATNFLTMVDSGASDGVDGSVALNITFNASVTGDEETVTVNYSVADGTTVNKTLQEVVDDINTAAGYTMAEAVEESPGNFVLQLASQSGTADNVTIEAVTGAETTITSANFTVAAENTTATIADFTETDLTDPASGINILTAESAISSLTTISAAIKTKDAARAAFGYKMNRLESTISILDIQAENLMAAESRISDVDVATEMAAMTRNQVLAQAGISMLGQANSMPQMALSLLK